MHTKKEIDEKMKEVTLNMIKRAAKYSKRKKRVIFISKTARGKGTPVTDLDPRKKECHSNIELFFNKVRQRYTLSNLGKPTDKNKINWRKISLSLGKRIFYLILTTFTMAIKGSKFKNIIFRIMGINIGKNSEIMMGAWLDHFRPELIFIGEKTLIGAFSKLSVHAYEGLGKFTFGIINIGNNCTISAGTAMGPIIIEDNVRILPSTTLSPYFTKLKAGSVVGWSKPDLQLPTKD